MQLHDGNDDRIFAWLVDVPLDLPTPPGMEWMTSEQIDGTYLLYESVVGEDL